MILWLFRHLCFPFDLSDASHCQELIFVIQVTWDRLAFFWPECWKERRRREQDKCSWIFFGAKRQTCLWALAVRICVLLFISKVAIWWLWTQNSIRVLVFYMWDKICFRFFARSQSKLLMCFGRRYLTHIAARSVCRLINAWCPWVILLIKETMSGRGSIARKSKTNREAALMRNHKFYCFMTSRWRGVSRVGLAENEHLNIVWKNMTFSIHMTLTHMNHEKLGCRAWGEYFWRSLCCPCMRWIIFLCFWSKCVSLVICDRHHGKNSSQHVPAPQDRKCSGRLSTERGDAASCYQIPCQPQFPRFTPLSIEQRSILIKIITAQLEKRIARLIKSWRSGWKTWWLKSQSRGFCG